MRLAEHTETTPPDAPAPLLEKEGMKTLALRRSALSGKEGNGRKPADFLLFVSFRFCL
jgi:hypothetical protein